MGWSDLPIPPSVVMLKNKVCMCINGVNVAAVVDTGAIILVMSLCFKGSLEHKVMFVWNCK